MTLPIRDPAAQGLPRMITQQLQQLIYGGEFKAGDRLNEAALAVRMGTSRGPIREAIRILAWPARRTLIFPTCLAPACTQLCRLLEGNI